MKFRRLQKDRKSTAGRMDVEGATLSNGQPVGSEKLVVQVLLGPPRHEAAQFTSLL